MLSPVLGLVLLLSSQSIIADRSYVNPSVAITGSVINESVMGHFAGGGRKGSGRAKGATNVRDTSGAKTHTHPNNQASATAPSPNPYLEFGTRVGSHRSPVVENSRVIRTA